MSRKNPSGAVHPTAFLLAWFGLGFGLQRLWPLSLPDFPYDEAAQRGLFAVGGLLLAWAFWTLRRHGTTADHSAPTTALVTDGPYRFSRHPVYVALVLILVALTIASESLWFLALTGLFWLFVQRLTVRREEAYLAREFGEAYERYRGAVRPWL